MSYAFTDKPLPEDDNEDPWPSMEELENDDDELDETLDTLFSVSDEEEDEEFEDEDANL